jgi:Tfp pilus assembly protein PilX
MKNNSTKGFTLLLAVLITSIILGISVGFSTFVIRELIISAMGRESQIAFFASDSGIECSLYWDLQQNAFATSSTSSINCAGSSRIVGGSSGISEFDLNFTNGACSHVKVDKTVYHQTKIDSYGRNTCNLSDPNRVERALEIIY